MRRLFVLCIRCYQWAVSPFLPRSCRFFPSCSEYAVETIERFGVWKGGGLAFLRIVKCHPWHPGGVDLAPKQ